MAAARTQLASVMTELKKLGTAQNVKIYRRHGAQEPLFGVSYALIGKLAKKLGKHHDLSLALWETGNFDARNLAAQVADPERITSKQLDAWAQAIDCYPNADSLVKLAAATPFARKKAEAWRKRSGEWVARSGWMLVAHLAMQGDPEDAPWLEGLLPIIEKNVHAQKNRVKDAMNYALIGIGGTYPKLKKPALASAGRMGKVEVDHGETGCKTRDASEYIDAMWKRKASRPAAKKKAAS